MTASIGGLSTAIIAVIAAGGIFGLLALITITSFLCNIPKRLREKKAAKEGGGRKSTDMNEVDVEKGAPAVSVTEVGSQVSHISKSTQSTRPPSPECRCEHPMPMPQVPTPMRSPRT
ncbi:hypothetical protein EK21DRAFT_114253 [Setomelanomma holmii]|uniref:Uncharacterized protein n=1 Tax=Setomelanomma holmii TaxID=210430 RepID=A0A9P4LKB3_9PLEO|nr:hypothetical protein EK21DRAFT_114253 [Setomelanomma holmii]